MNTRQFFFISLIVLSIAMGMNWFKNKPKVVKKPQPKIKQAINFDDLQNQDKDDDQNTDEEKEEEKNKKISSDAQTTETKTDDETQDESDGVEETEEEEEESDNNETDKNQTISENQNQVASETTTLPATDTAIIDSPLKDDEIMKEYFQITRNPFETSPYAQLVEKLRLEAEIAAMPKTVEEKEVKKITLINDALTGTIETARGLRAIIEGNVYLKGEFYRQHKITEIKNEVVIMDTDNETFIITKPGVNVNIDEETGEYTIEDTYEQ